MCRVVNKQKLKNGEDSAIIHGKCDSSTSEPLCHHEKRFVFISSYCLGTNSVVSSWDIITLVPLNICRKSQRGKSARLDSVPSRNMITSETLDEDVIAPLAPSTSNASVKDTEGQITGRRSLRRAAEKVVSYKEVPLNVKMRRP